MPRKIVPLITGDVYHVFNRGVDKRAIFNTKRDFIRFYQSLYFFNVIEPVHEFRSASKSKPDIKQEPLVSLHAYSLLPNHFHFLIQQEIDGGISEFMKRLMGGYTTYYNEQYKRSGSLFQGTFKRVRIDSDEQYQYLFAYVSENHSVHNIPRPPEIIYSSSFHHQGLLKSKLITRSHLTSHYNFHAQSLLARDIFERRASEKRMLHEDE